MQLREGHDRQASLRELLHDVRAEAHAGIVAYVNINKLTFENGSTEPPALDVRNLRQFADRQATTVRDGYLNAYRAIHGWRPTEFEAHAETEAERVRQWSELEPHLGWRHAYRDTMMAAKGMVIGLMRRFAKASDADIEDVLFVRSWLDRNDPETNTRTVLSKNMSGEPGVALWTRLPSTLDRDADGPLPASARDDAIHAEFRDPVRAVRQPAFREGYRVGMEEAAEAIDMIIGGVDRSQPRLVTDVLREVAESIGHDLQLQQTQTLFRNGDAATEQRKVVEAAEAAATNALKLAGMVPSSWETALDTEAGRRVQERVQPPAGVTLAEFLQNDFDAALRQADQFRDPDLPEVREPDRLMVDDFMTLDPLDRKFELVS
jgi:hypothetical protein